MKIKWLSMLTCILKTKTKRYTVHDPCGPQNLHWDGADCDDHQCEKEPGGRKICSDWYAMGWVRNNRVMLGYGRGGNLVVSEHTLLVCQHVLASFAFLG